MSGIVKAIYIAPAAGANPVFIQDAKLIAGRGIEGDRYFNGQGTFSKQLKDLPDRELTLIEREAIDEFNGAAATDFAEWEFRRNLVVSGIHLNDLVGHEFKVGSIRVRGIRLCEPCRYLGACLAPELERLMVASAGLRAQILDTGLVSVGDTVRGDTGSRS